MRLPPDVFPETWCDRCSKSFSLIFRLSGSRKDSALILSVFSNRCPVFWAQPSTGSCASAVQVRVSAHWRPEEKSKVRSKLKKKKKEGGMKVLRWRLWSHRGKKGVEGWTATEEGDKCERWHTVKRMEMGQAEVETQERQRKRSRVLF